MIDSVRAIFSTMKSFIWVTNRSEVVMILYARFSLVFTLSSLSCPTGYSEIPRRREHRRRINDAS